MKRGHGGRLHPASAGTVYAVVRQGADDELFSSPAGRDAWARAGTMTGSNLAVSAKAAWFGISRPRQHVPVGDRRRRALAQVPIQLAGRPWAGGIAAAGSWQVAGGRWRSCAAPRESTYHSAKEVLLSVNGGRTEHLTGQAPVAGDVAARERGRDPDEPVGHRPSSSRQPITNGSLSP